MGTDEIRVLVVAADPLARAGLAALVDAQPACSVVGQTAPEEDVSAALDLYRAEIVVWDMGWDPSDALELVSGLGEGTPPVVALVGDDTRGARVIAAGARGVLSRDVDADSLEAGLVAVSRGLVVTDPALVPAPGPHGGPPPDLPVAGLTPRERDVLRLVAEGMPNKSIARTLGVSDHTVKFHVNAILSKLGAQSRTEAVTRAARLGLLVL